MDFSKDYKMSFSVGDLFYSESINIAKLYLEIHDWKLVREKVMRENTIQARKKNSLKRITPEIISRLKTLSDEEMYFLINGSINDSKIILWLSICRTYRFIREFAREIIFEKHIRLDISLDKNDFVMFFNKKADISEKLNDLKDSTVNKIRQVLYKILRDAGILSEDNTINSVLISEELERLISKRDIEELRYF